LSRSTAGSNAIATIAVNVPADQPVQEVIKGSQLLAFCLRPGTNSVEIPASERQW